MYQFNANAAQIINGTHILPPHKHGAILAIGNFDGVHKGHQYILNHAQKIAQKNGNMPIGALTFSPHPRAFFNPDGQFFRLTDNIVRAELFASLGIDLLVILEFCKQLAGLTAEEFVQKILVNMLNISHVIVGEDFCFGKARQGDAKFLQQMGEKYGFGVSVLSKITTQDEIVSSSRIRRALEQGEIELASDLLGHDWYVNGVVEKGKQLGRTIGFPTANIAMRADCELRHGSYAATIIVAGKAYSGAASYGTRPTVNGIGTKMETFIFDFDQDIYGQDVKVYLHKFIRADEKLDGLDALIAAINDDVAKVKQYFAENGAKPRQIQKLV
ncbi:MAG: bifunctional riboflavin kinase/FAD synthetase [Alphaproteobacteria bacterium]|nr:bifunctional riboflavin kinase/FAD synthetase [Alphaproteobacteria bacterium]